MAVTVVRVVFHMGPLGISSASFHIPYGLYAISYGRTSNIMCYLSEVLAIVYMQCPMFSRLIPFAYLIYDISDYRVSMLFLSVCMPLNMVYAFSFLFFGYFLWLLCNCLMFEVVSPMCSILFLVVSIAFFSFIF